MKRAGAGRMAGAWTPAQTRRKARRRAQEVGASGTSFWLAETLKYFLLLFSDDSLLDLNTHVINRRERAGPRRFTPFHHSVCVYPIVSTVCGAAAGGLAPAGAGAGPPRGARERARPPTVHV